MATNKLQLDDLPPRVFIISVVTEKDVSDPTYSEDTKYNHYIGYSSYRTWDINPKDSVIIGLWVREKGISIDKLVTAVCFEISPHYIVRIAKEFEFLKQQ